MSQGIEIYFYQVNNYINYKDIISLIQEVYQKVKNLQKDIESSMQPGTTWVYQKEIRDRRLLLKCPKLNSTP